MSVAISGNGYKLNSMVKPRSKLYSGDGLPNKNHITFCRIVGSYLLLLVTTTKAFVTIFKAAKLICKVRVMRFSEN